MPPTPPIAVLGGGLAGSLLALALARRGPAVLLVAPEAGGATPLSYGGIPSARACRAWRALEARHGPLGFRPASLALHGWPPPLSRLPPQFQALLSAPLPFGRVDSPALLRALPAALAAAGVERVVAEVGGIAPEPSGGWQLLLSGRDGAAAGRQRSAAQVVLATGARSRLLWPDLPARFGFSWAGVIALSPAALQSAAGAGWLELGRRGALLQPLRLLRPALEETDPQEQRWIVDAGLVSWGESVLLGQISLVGPGLDPDRPPDPEWMEARLRQGLERLDPALAALQGRYRQVPVAFCRGGDPLVGPVAEAPPGLWCFTGFSGAFSVVPAEAEALAERIVAASRPPASSTPGASPFAGAA